MGGKGSGRTPYKHLASSPSAGVERSWPVRNPGCADIELQNEAVNTLHNLLDAIKSNLVVNGEPNPLISDLEIIESVCIDNDVLLPTRKRGAKSLLRMMAEGQIMNGQT